MRSNTLSDVRPTATVTTATIITPAQFNGGAADIDQLAQWLDSEFRIPGTRLRFGYDSIVGMVPVVGDGITTALGLYIIVRARRLGAPPLLIARMLLNLGIDSVFGSIPLIGDAFDFLFKSNRKNIELLRRHLARRAMRQV
jgi:Domain of unknown function (DUF4112)